MAFCPVTGGSWWPREEQGGGGSAQLATSIKRSVRRRCRSRSWSRSSKSSGCAAAAWARTGKAHATCRWLPPPPLLSSFSLAWSLATALAAAATTTAATAVALRRDAGSYRRPLSACTVDKKHSNRTRSLRARRTKAAEDEDSFIHIHIHIYEYEYEYIRVYPFAVLISRGLVTFVFDWKASESATFSILAAFALTLFRLRTGSQFPRCWPLPLHPAPPLLVDPVCIYVITVLPEHGKIAAFVPGCRHAGAAAAPGSGHHTQLARNYYHRCGRCPLPPSHFPCFPYRCNWNWGRPKRRRARSWNA